MIRSSQSLQSSLSGAQQQWKRSSGMPVQIVDNQPITTLALKDADDNISELQIDIGHFRYVASEAFLTQIRDKHRSVYPNSNATHFQCVVNNGSGVYDKNSMQTQTFSTMDIIYQFSRGEEQFYVYGQIDKIGQYIEVPISHKIDIGFGVFTKDNQIIKPDLNFGDTNYIFMFYIE